MPLPPSTICGPSGLSMPHLHQASIGIETVLGRLRLQASYMMQRGVDQLRSVNINAPPSPAVAGRSRASAP